MLSKITFRMALASVRSRVICGTAGLQFVVFAIVVLAVPPACAADGHVDYFEYLPGDHHEQDPEHGITSNAPETMHGASTYFGWTSTNKFVRNFLISYDMLSVKGEPKHGLWKWTVPGTDPGSPKIWWCELGGAIASGASSGHVDASTATSALAGQSGMGPVWEMIREMHRVNDPGTKAAAAKFSSVAQTFARVYLSASANVWGNAGTGSKPSYEIVDSSEGRFEWYVFEAYYNRSSQQFSTKSEIDGAWSPDQPCKMGVTEAEV